MDAGISPSSAGVWYNGPLMRRVWKEELCVCPDYLLIANNGESGQFMLVTKSSQVRFLEERSKFMVLVRMFLNGVWPC